MPTLLETRPSLCFNWWKPRLQMAMDIDQLTLVVAAYRSVWADEDLLKLPMHLAAPIRNASDLMERAFEASRAEIEHHGSNERYEYLREFSLCLAFAANRLRYLQALRTNGFS